MAIRIRSSLALLAGVAVVLPVAAGAAESRIDVERRHGEMVLLRDVNARHAYRPVPPSVALIVDPTPTRELNRMLGTGELGDDDFAAISSGYGAGMGRPGTTTVESVTAAALGAGPGSSASGHAGGVSGAGIGGALSTPLGAVGAGTRGIGGHVSGALSQFPLGQPGGAGSGGP